MLESLDSIAIRHGTDKATQFTRTYAKPKSYTVHYERFFAPLRDQPIKLVEIGVGGGESIRTWLEYFSWSFVIGIDTVHDTNKWNTPKQFGNPSDGIPKTIEDRYSFMAADQTDPVFWKCFAADVKQTIDIAVDDGAHQPKACHIAMDGLWPLIKPGGLYCVEDLGCGFTDPGFPTHPEVAARSASEMITTGIDDIDSIYLAKELMIVRKKL